MVVRKLKLETLRHARGWPKVPDRRAVKTRQKPEGPTVSTPDVAQLQSMNAYLHKSLQRSHFNRSLRDTIPLGADSVLAQFLRLLSLMPRRLPLAASDIPSRQSK